MLSTNDRTEREGGAVSLSAHLTARHGRAWTAGVPPRLSALPGASGWPAASQTTRSCRARTQAALAAGVLAFSAAAPLGGCSGPRGRPGAGGQAAPGGEPPGLEPDFDPGRRRHVRRTTPRRSPAARRPAAARTRARARRWRPSRPPTPTPACCSTSQHAPAPPPPAPEPMPAPTPAAAVCACRRPPPVRRRAAAGRAGAASAAARAALADRASARRPSGPPRPEPERRPVVGTSPTPRPDSRARRRAPRHACLYRLSRCRRPLRPGRRPSRSPAAPAAAPVRGDSYTVRRGRQPLVDRAAAARPGGLGGPDRPRGQPALGAQPGADRHRRPRACCTSAPCCEL